MQKKKKKPRNLWEQNRVTPKENAPRKKNKDNRTHSEQELVVYRKKESVPTHLDHNNVLDENEKEK